MIASTCCRVLLAALLALQGGDRELRVLVSDAAGLAVAATVALTSESNQLHEQIATDLPDLDVGTVQALTS